MVLKCRCCLLASLQLLERLDDDDQLAKSQGKEVTDMPLRAQPEDLAGQSFVRSGPLLPPLCCAVTLLLLSEEWSVSVSCA